MVYKVFGVWGAYLALEIPKGYLVMVHFSQRFLARGVYNLRKRRSMHILQILETTAWRF